MIYETKCQKCRETFNPDSPEDTIHIVRLDGEECGGQGEIPLVIWGHNG